MVGLRRMGHIARLKLGHMTSDTRILLRPSPFQRQAAAPLGMALQTACAIEVQPLLNTRQAMRIVAGNAPQPTIAGSIATAFTHLLNMTDGHRLLIL